MKSLVYIVSVLFFSYLLLVSCGKKGFLVRTESTQLQITDSILGDAAIEKFIRPYRINIQQHLDSVLAFAPETYDKANGELNTAIGNLMADIVMEQANLVFNSRTQKTIDMVLLNYGGIRAPIPQGDVTVRTAYQVMPFENHIIVVEMKGTAIKQLINYLQMHRTAHPISGLKLSVTADFELVEATLKGREIQNEEVYYVATNDYLYAGGDGMSFFEQGTTSYRLDYKIRNAMIDYFTKMDTIAPVIDDRFIQLN